MTVKKWLLGASLSVYLVNSVGCGVLLYPERQGQSGGKIDPVVAVLNGVGLLFYVIPGLVAFAIDFHQGTIYLPPGGDGLISNDDLERNYNVVKVDGEMTQENIEAALKAALGHDVDITAANVQAQVIKDGLPGLDNAFALAQARTLASL